jgi:hypothetical protein
MNYRNRYQQSKFEYFQLPKNTETGKVTFAADLIIGINKLFFSLTAAMRATPYQTDLRFRLLFSGGRTSPGACPRIRMCRAHRMTVRGLREIGRGHRPVNVQSEITAYEDRARIFCVRAGTMPRRRA